MLNRFISVFTVSAALAGLVGCAAPYTVKQQTRPNPFANRASFELAPLDFTSVHLHDGRGDTPWTEIDRRTFERAKRSLSAAFEKEVIDYLGQGGVPVTLAGAPGAEKAAFVIEPHVVEITPGDFTGVGGAGSHLRVRVAISNRRGQVLDVLEVEHGTTGDPLAGDTSRRMILDGGIAGERLAGYLHERAVPGSELR